VAPNSTESPVDANVEEPPDQRSRRLAFSTIIFSIATEQRELVSKVDKAVQKGALHRNTGARKKAKAARIAAGAKAA